jgi:hypothetical protein
MIDSRLSRKEDESMAKRAGLPQEAGGAGSETGAKTKKGRGPNKPGVFVEFPAELASEIKAAAGRFGNGNATHTKLAHADITGLIAREHQQIAETHIGKVGEMYFAELKRRAENPLADAFK